MAIIPKSVNPDFFPRGGGPRTITLPDGTVIPIPSGPFTSCPALNEEVLLADKSWILAKDLKVGDEVATHLGSNKVTYIDILKDRTQKEVIFTNGEKENSIVTSDTHPYYVENEQGFVEVKDLKIGDKVGEFLVKEIKDAGKGSVAHISIDEAQTYFLKAGDEAVLSHNKRPALPKTPVTPRGPIIPTIGGLLGGDFPISKIPGLPNIPNINLPNIDFSNIPQGIKIPGLPNIPNISRVSEPVVQDMMFRDPENEFVSTKPPLTLGAPVNQAIDVQPPQAPAGGTFMASPSVVVFGPDGKMYGSPAAARAAGVTDYTMTPPGARSLSLTQPVSQETAVGPMSAAPVTQPVVQDTIAESLANIPVSGTAPTNQVDPVLKGITPTEVLSDPFVRELYFGSPDTPGLIAQATEAAQKSFLDQPAILQQTAGLSPFEQEARGLAAAGIGSYEPFLREASGAYRGGLGSLYGSIGFGGPSARDYLGMSLEQYDPRMMGAFYDPFEQQVVQQTISDALQAAAQQDIQQRAADISRGGESAFGSRARLGAEERQRSLGRGLGETLGKIRSGGFQNAQDRALQELERRRSGARSAAQLESGFGGQLSQAQRLYGSDISGLGRMGQQLRGADISQLAGLGSTARGIEEQRLAREYAQQQATRMAPLQATQFVKGFAPQYVPGKTQIEKQYGMPVDPLTYGLSTAFGTYAQFVPQQQQQQTQQAGIAGLPQGQFTFTGGYPQQTPTYGGYQPTPYSTPGGYI